MDKMETADFFTVLAARYGLTRTKAFIDAIRAEEREACAKIAVRAIGNHYFTGDGATELNAAMTTHGETIANAIRQRSDEG